MHIIQGNSTSIHCMHNHKSLWYTFGRWSVLYTTRSIVFVLHFWFVFKELIQFHSQHNIALYFQLAFHKQLLRVSFPCCYSYQIIIRQRNGTIRLDSSCCALYNRTATSLQVHYPLPGNLAIFGDIPLKDSIDFLYKIRLRWDALLKFLKKSWTFQSRCRWFINKSFDILQKWVT